MDAAGVGAVARRCCRSIRCWDSETNRLDGVKALLARTGASCRDQLVRKRRLQTSAQALLAGVPGFSIDRPSLGERVEFRLAERDEPVWSLCIEAAEPARIRHGEVGAAIVGGYPELLSR